MQPTITLEEANRKVDEYIERAHAQLPDTTKLDERLRFEDDPCDDPDDQGPGGRKIASRNYEVTGIDASKIPAYFDTLREWWLKNSFHILENRRKYEFLWVENTEDGFRMTLKANDQGRLALIAASPCVWPNGTPEASGAGDDNAASTDLEPMAAPVDEQNKHAGTDPNTVDTARGIDNLHGRDRADISRSSPETTPDRPLPSGSQAQPTTPSSLRDRDDDDFDDINFLR